MPSYKNLAITALAAAASVSPALSAPIREGQKQSRAELEQRRDRSFSSGAGAGIALRPLMYPYPMYPYPPPPLTPIHLPKPGDSSKRAADAPESQAIAELEGPTAGKGFETQRAMFAQRDVSLEDVALLGRTLNELD